MNLEIGLIHLFRHETTPNVPSTKVHCFLPHCDGVDAVVEGLRISDQPTPSMSIDINLTVILSRLTIQYTLAG